MELILGAFFEFILEGSTTVGTNKKYSKWIRYPLLLLAGVIYVGIITLMIFDGFLALGDELWQAKGTWIFALAFIITSIWAFHKEYKKKENQVTIICV